MARRKKPESERAVRLADVAKAAGVSQGTASNVFNRPGLVREEVRERVDAAARALGYAGPDPKGRLLRAGKVNAIGVVTADTLTYFFEDPFMREFMAGLVSVLDEVGAGVSLISALDREAAAWTIGSAVVDGFVLHCLEDAAKLIGLAERRGLPFVAVDIDAAPGISTVQVDDRGGARLAAEHLLALGHRRFAILALLLREDNHTGPVDRERRHAATFSVTRERLLGYADAFAAAGIAIDDIPIIEADVDPEAAAAGAAMILDAAPEATAILSMADTMALALLDEAARRRIEVPRDLSVVGFDGIAAGTLSRPPLTTVAQPILEKGRRAARMLLEKGAPRTELLATSLVIRGSTAPPRH